MAAQAILHVGTKKAPLNSRDTTSLPRRPWSMIAYIAGDNNLSDNGLEDIEEMCEVGTDRSLYCGVEIDTAGEHEGSVRYQISEPDPTGVSHRIVIDRLPERNTGDPRTLTNFLDWGLRRFHARNRLLVVWGHGCGFRKRQRTVAPDYSSGESALSVPSVELALLRAGIGKGRPFGQLKLMGFDACLMCMLEIAHHLRAQTEYLVGSQQEEPGDGWPYNRVLDHLHGAPHARDVAAAIVDEYVAYYRRSGETGVTQSAIETAKTVAVVGALHDLGESLAKAFPAEHANLHRARVATLSFDDGHYVDAVDLADQISSFIDDPGIRRRAARFKRATLDAVVASKTYGRDMRNANGLSIWYPATRQEFIDNRSKYMALHLNDERHDWVRFLDTRFAV